MLSIKFVHDLEKKFLFKTHKKNHWSSTSCKIYQKRLECDSLTLVQRLTAVWSSENMLETGLENWLQAEHLVKDMVIK